MMLEFDFWVFIFQSVYLILQQWIASWSCLTESDDFYLKRDYFTSRLINISRNSQHSSNDSSSMKTMVQSDARNFRDA